MSFIGLPLRAAPHQEIGNGRTLLHLTRPFSSRKAGTLRHVSAVLHVSTVFIAPHAIAVLGAAFPILVNAITGVRSTSAGSK